jgi:hypothetical protein
VIDDGHRGEVVAVGGDLGVTETVQQRARRELAVLAHLGVAACREERVAQLTLARNDAIQWNAIVVIVSTVRIVVFAGVVSDGGSD